MSEIQLLISGDHVQNRFIDNVPPGESQDAYKLIGSNITHIDCKTVDKIGRTEGHCDDIQIIPTKSFTRYFGEIAENIKITGGKLDSDGSMQGVASFDGGIRGLILRGRKITTESEHYVSLCGVLDGCEISNIKDKYGNYVRIFLDSMRIGGGAKGNFYVSSFLNHTYGTVKTDQPIEDKRGLKWRKGAEYVDNFDLDLFLSIANEFEYEDIETHLAETKRRYFKAVERKPSKMKIALIIGHNSKYQGKKIYGSSEYLFWKQALNEWLNLWNTPNIELKIFERPAIKSYSKQVEDVHNRIDEWGANISVSCHFNAFSGNVNGHEVLYNPGSKGGKLFAETFNKSMNVHLTNNNRGHKPATERGRYGLRYGKSKTILIEPFFAKQLKDYEPGGKHRSKLFDSFQGFFDSVQGQKPGLVVKRTAMFTDEELEIALRLLG